MCHAENDLLTGIPLIFMQTYSKLVYLNTKVNINSV